MNILVSACLLGVECRYNGKGVLEPGMKELMKRHHLVPVCPEIMGGLATPRTPAEQRAGRVLTRDGKDVTEAYRRGARQVLGLARLYDCRVAVMKERSPSCGRGRIYDGTFSGTLTDGNGVCAELLASEGIAVYGESELEEMIRRLEGNKDE